MYTITIIATSATGGFIKIQSVNFGWLFDIWQMVILQIIFVHKCHKKYYKVFIALVMLLAFQIFSLITKDIGFKTLTENTMTSILFSIDIIIMEILYYAYENLKIQNKKGG